MYCRNCGKELPDGAKFCPGCGKENKSDFTYTRGGDFQPTFPQETKKAGPKLGFIAGAIAAVLVVVIALVFLIIRPGFSGDSRQATSGNDDRNGEVSTASVSARSEEEGEKGSVKGYSASAAKIVGDIEELNDDSFEDEGVVLYAENHSPGKRDTSLVWDRNIFYTMEGYQTDAAYVNKYSCTLERKSILTTDGDTLSCDVYLNPDNGLPNKIVVIDYLDDGIEVTEIYYTNEGKPNFTFRYTTDNYVATYATPDKDGVRCQFEKDVLVNWRIVEGKSTHNYVIGQNMVDFLSSSWAADTIYMLDNQSADLQDEFDNIEIKMLNYAYNIYDAEMNESGVERARITGRVVDQKGKPCKGAQVNLYDEHMENKYYTTKTNSKGVYIIYIPYEEHTYSIEINQKIDGQKCKSSIHHIRMDGDRDSVDQEDVYLIPEGEEQTVSLSLHCENTDGSSANADFSTGVVNVREGHDNYDGDVFLTAESDAKGKVSLNLPAGGYTLEILVDGCQTIFKNITVGDDTKEISCLVIPEVKEKHYSIIATWDGDLDPDIHWFDLDDAQEISDHTENGASGYCITDLDIRASDYYKYCVLDAINAAAEKKDAKDMSSSGLTIYIYGPDGLEYVFVVPVDTEGILWEVFEIRNGKIQPIQRYYDTLEDADWWNNENSNAADHKDDQENTDQSTAQSPLGRFIGEDGLQSPADGVYINFIDVEKTDDGMYSIDYAESYKRPHYDTIAEIPVNEPFEIHGTYKSSTEDVQMIYDGENCITVLSEAWDGSEPVEMNYHYYRENTGDDSAGCDNRWN